MKFTLTKSKWLRGNGNDSVLLDCNGQQCCVGQLLSQCGLDDTDLLDVGTGEYLSTDVPGDVNWLLVTNDDPDGSWGLSDSPDASLLYGINDDAETTDDEKIEKLRPILAKHGIELEVVE